MHIERVRGCGGIRVADGEVGYGHPATPALGIPDAELSAFCRSIFEGLRDLALVPSDECDTSF